MRFVHALACTAFDGLGLARPTVLHSTSPSGSSGIDQGQGLSGDEGSPFRGLMKSEHIATPRVEKTLDAELPSFPLDPGYVRSYRSGTQADLSAQSGGLGGPTTTSSWFSSPELMFASLSPETPLRRYSMPTNPPMYFQSNPGGLFHSQVNMSLGIDYLSPRQADSLDSAAPSMVPPSFGTVMDEECSMLWPWNDSHLDQPKFS